MKLHFIDITSSYTGVNYPGIPMWIDLERIVAISALVALDHTSGHRFSVYVASNANPIEFSITQCKSGTTTFGYNTTSFTLVQRTQSELEAFVEQYDLLLEAWSSLQTT